VTNLSLNDGGINSKVSVLGVPFKGLPIAFPDDERGERWTVGRHTERAS
jgi:hypothetical protein